MQRSGIHSITFTIRCESGLHIGGSQDELTIGGADHPVVKNPATGAPYIPGSSLKGKMCAELEENLGRFNSDGSPTDHNHLCGCTREQCVVCRVFGPHFNTSSTLGPARIMVRDGQVLGTDYRLRTKTKPQLTAAPGPQ